MQWISNFLLMLKKTVTSSCCVAPCSMVKRFRNPNKIAAFEAALMGHRCAFRHQHAMGAGMGVPTVGEAGRVIRQPDSDAGFSVFQETFGEQSLTQFGYETLLSGHGPGVEDRKSFGGEGASPPSICFTLPGLPNNGFSAGSAARRVP